MDSTSIVIDAGILDSTGNQPMENPRQTRLVENCVEISKDTDDFELTRLAGDGNLQAFETLYAKYHRRTYSICLRMTNNVTEAEDLTQEVFIQLFRKVGSFRGESAFTTWLHRLTVNQVLMHFRKRSVKNEKTTEDGEIPEYALPQSKYTSNLPILTRLDLKKAVSELPPGYRAVFLLHDVEGFEHAEVAEMLGVSVGTSKSQLHKARLKLRGLLLKENE
ncbi:MAG: RNA polymerase sigma factor [Pyrinomonadaceae bacterium]